jgi:hypothetical protein
MSKKRKKQKKGYPWWLIILGGALLVIAGFTLTNQKGSDTGGGTPAITVDQQKIDHGDVKLNTNLTFTIKVTNAGNGTLHFRESPYIEVMEGC